MKKEFLPDHVKKDFPTMHAWRSHKRRQAKIARRAVHDLLIGCAFTPARQIGVILGEMDRVIEELSVKNWGR